MPSPVLWRNGWVAIPSGRARRSSSAREPLSFTTYGLAPRRFLSESPSCLQKAKSAKKSAAVVPATESDPSETKTHEDPALSAACQRMSGVPKALPQALNSIIEDPPAPAWREVGEKLRSSILLVDRKIALDVSVSSRLSYLIPLTRGNINLASQSIYSTLMLHLADVIEQAVKAGQQDVAFSEPKYKRWLKSQGFTREGRSKANLKQLPSTTERDNVETPTGLSESAAAPKRFGLLAKTSAGETVNSAESAAVIQEKNTHHEKVSVNKPDFKTPITATSPMSEKKPSSVTANSATKASSTGSVPVAQVKPVAGEKATIPDDTSASKTATKGRGLTKAKTKKTVPEAKESERQTAFKSTSNTLLDSPVHPRRQKTIAKLGADRLLSSNDAEIVDLAGKIPQLLGFVPTDARFIKAAKWCKKIRFLYDKSVTTGSVKDAAGVKRDMRLLLEFVVSAMPPERKEWAKSFLATPSSTAEMSDSELAKEAQESSVVAVTSSSPQVSTEAPEADPNSVGIEDSAEIAETQVLSRKRAKRNAERIRASSRPVRPTRTASRVVRAASSKGGKKSRKVDAEVDVSQATTDGQEGNTLLPAGPPPAITLEDIERPAVFAPATVASYEHAIESGAETSLAPAQDPAQLSTPRGYEAVAKRERRIRLAMEAKKAAAAQLNALNALGKPTDESTLSESVPQPVLATMMDAKMAAMAEEQNVQVLRQIRYAPAIKRNAVMFSVEKPRSQETIEAGAEVEIPSHSQNESVDVLKPPITDPPLVVSTPSILSKHPELPATFEKEQIDLPPTLETLPESAPPRSGFFDVLKGATQTVWDWFGGARPEASSLSPKADQVAQEEPPGPSELATTNKDDTIMEQIDNLLAGLQRNKKDFGEALEEELARHAEEQSVELLAYRENFHRTSGVSCLPADLEQQLVYQDVAIGQVNFLEDRRRVLWEFSHWTSVGPIRVDKDKSRKEAYRAFHHAINHADPTLMIYSDGSFRDSQMGRTTSQRFAGGGILIKTPLPISYSISLGTTMRGSDEAELATYLWAIRMVRTLLTSPVGEAIRAEQNYKRVLFATDSTNTLRGLSRIRQGGVPDARTIMLLSMIQVEAIALSRLFGGLDILGLWVPREFNREIQLADQLAVKGSAQARMISESEPKARKGKKK